MTSRLSILFAILASAFTLSTLFTPYPLSWLLKMLPVLTLLIIVFRSIVNKKDYLLLFALLFSALGDFFLDYNRDGWFIFGLGSFLIAHLFYTTCFWPLQKKHLFWVAAYCMFGLSMFLLIKGQLGDLMVPVIVYMLVLLAMGVAALTSKRSNNWLIIGGVSFVISDSLIAIDKFYLSIVVPHFFIMLTYYFAQYALVKGYLDNQRN